MPRLVNQNPSYRKHRASGQAIVTIDGQDIYLGPHGTKASKSEYDRIIGEWLANGRRLAGTSAGGVVSDLVHCRADQRVLEVRPGLLQRREQGTSRQHQAAP